MKKILFITLFIIPLFLSSQSNYSSSLQVTGGYVEDGFGIMTSYDYYFSKVDMVQFSLTFNLANDREGIAKVPYAIFAVHPSYFRKIIEARRGRLWDVQLGAGGILGYESINSNSNELPSGAILTAKSGFIYGVFIGGELEYHLDNENFSMLLKANQHYHINSELGKFQPYIGIGLKYYLF